MAKVEPDTRLNISKYVTLEVLERLVTKINENINNYNEEINTKISVNAEEINNLTKEVDSQEVEVENVVKTVNECRFIYYDVRKEVTSLEHDFNIARTFNYIVSIIDIILVIGLIIALIL